MSKLERFPLIAIVGFDTIRALEGWQRRVWQFIVAFACLVALAIAILRAHMMALLQREDMRRLAVTDALTGIANRRHFMAIGAHEIARAKRYARSLSVLMLDIDRFKSINDTWGHSAGDRVIQEVANTMSVNFRNQDTCGRLGGEEFAVILPETNLSKHSYLPSDCVLSCRSRRKSSLMTRRDSDFPSALALQHYGRMMAPLRQFCTALMRLFIRQRRQDGIGWCLLC